MKHETTDKVIDAIRAVAQGQTYVSGALAAQLTKKYVGASDATDLSISGRLSDRELEIFLLIGLGRETRRIAEDLHVSMKTCEASSSSLNFSGRLFSECTLSSSLCGDRFVTEMPFFGGF